MNPPRWNSPNADKVRDELARRFENENSPVPDTKITMWDSRHRANTVRLAAPIDDVDGDGKPNTEWAGQALGGTLQFGITTVSGATISGSQGFAGGGDRTFVVGKLANGVVVAITSEDRDSPVYTFSGCAFHTLRGGDLFSGPDKDSQFTFYSADGGGDGACYDGRLALVHLTNMPGDPTGDNEQAIARWVDVSADGLRATLTDQSATIATNLNYTTDPTRYFHYNGTSCGPSEVLHPVYHAK